MRLDVIGSSGTYPSPGNPSSGYLITDGSTRILCDVGFGVLAGLLERIEIEDLDAVVLSHRHPDHCADFLALHHAIAYGPLAVSGLPVFAAAEVVERMAAFLGAGPGHVLYRSFDFTVVGDGDAATVGSVDLTFAAAAHSVPTVATRFESGGNALVYSADTGPGGGFPGLCDGAAVVMAEASLPGGRAESGFPHHLTAAEAGEIARKAGAGLLILTHLRPSLDAGRAVADAMEAFGGRVEIASPGDIYEIEREV